ncbi:hypothetical protein GCM10027612_74640 [Microbispora bryophytorum subsp. camponoti]
MVISVDDAADPRLSDYVRLRDVDLRKSVESERGLFVAEGEKVIRRAIGAGHPVRSVLTTAKWLDALADVVGAATVYVVSDRVMEGITGFQVHRGALAAMERTPLPRPASSSRTRGRGSSSWRTWSTTATWGRSSAARRRSASARSCCRRAAPTPCIAGPSRCRWGRFSRSRTPG